MKRSFSVCLAFLLAALLFAPEFEAAAQGPKLKRIGRSLNTLVAPVRGAPAPPWFLATGLKVIGKQSKAYYQVDTVGSGVSGSPMWTLVSKPAGSTTALDSSDGNLINSFKADTLGEYIVSVTVGTQTKYDTTIVSTYTGVGTDPKAGCFCHANAVDIASRWRNTGHGKIFTEGITGYLETERGAGAYAAACVKCHTTGWDPTANNNNFGYQAKQTGWDTTWYKGLSSYAGDYWITTGDTSVYHTLNASQRATGTVGCETCHGPSYDHKIGGLTGNFTSTIDKTLDAGVCNQCHDGSRRHSIGTYYDLSVHAKLPTGTVSEGGRSNCQPCHTGRGFLYYLDHNKDTTGIAAVWNLDTDAGTPISCQVCHDPHGNDNPAYLRTVTVDSLRNGYRVPAGVGGVGQFCANCHASRYSVKARVTTKSPYYGFVNRYGPHENPQGDMFYGSNGYQYGDDNLTGQGTHHGLENGCVTCHMQGRMNRLDGSANVLPNHSFSMEDTTFATGVYKPVDVCKNCHGEIEEFDDIKASYDYDGNGKIEGVQTEVQGLLDRLKTRLPIDASTGEPVTMTKDSLLVKNRPDLVQGIWNYYFVKNDKSLGVHNSKYAVALLQKSLGIYPLDVKRNGSEIPKEFALNQNYPNPFNPTTTINFSLPQTETVRLEVYDVTGKLVKTLVSQDMSAGSYSITWLGDDQNHAKVASGMYLYKLQAGSFSSVKKMLMLK
jgi:hypothetical protein